jgi:Asp-tRNA(Asn)/Glu-tRNA(Gln) amidotransferase A subunit family amidase
VAEPISAGGWLRRLAARELSAQELVTHVLARLDAVEALNAVAARDDEAALAAAAAADAARSGGDERPLLGLPVSIKDSLATSGLRTASGSRARARHVPDRDATVVARLRAAGAIVVCKSAVPEYTWAYETESALQGRTLNPHAPERTCGGSSGGEAALLGADASIVGIGTDGGGSIRVPSHYCGVVGHRPTAGLVPETGCWPSTRDTGMLDINGVGPMARFVADLALLLPLVAGADGQDPFVHAAAAPTSAGPPAPGLRIGFYTDDGVWPTTDATRRAVERAARALASARHEVAETPPPGVAEATDLFFALMAADGGARAREDLAGADRHVPSFARLLEDLRPLAVDAAGFFELVRRLYAFRQRVRAFVGRFDLVLAPVAAGPAPLHGRSPGDDAEADSYLPFNYTHAYSLAGLPVTVIRAGDEGGLPLGVQIVAGAFRDELSLLVAGALEEALGSFRGPPEAFAAAQAVA